MSREIELWQFIATYLRQGKPVMLLVVAESRGSSPGRQGFKMVVTGTAMCGSVGGGVMEVNLVEQARTILAEESPSPDFISRQTHQKNSANASGMICSGKQTVIFKLIRPENAETVTAVIDSLENRKRDVLAISTKDLDIKQPTSDDRDFRFESNSETQFEYRERLGPKNELYLVGGGHCALALSELMSRMDFYIRIFDDRPELNTIEKNTFAHEKHLIESYEQIGDRIPGGPNVCVVVMTLGFTSDEVVIRKLLDKKFKYFGVLGSKAKMATLLKDLRTEGVPAARLQAIRTPVGLPINSQTPEEIAISIAAEIIQVKNAISS